MLLEEGPGTIWKLCAQQAHCSYLDCIYLGQVKKDLGG